MIRPAHRLNTALLVGMLGASSFAFGSDRHEHPAVTPGLDSGRASNGDHSHGIELANTRPAPALVGQYAFATIAEILMLLENDSETDWSRVDLEHLRQHLIDMDRVTLGAKVVPANVTGGARFSVTSEDPHVRDSIRRMTAAHAATMNHEGGSDRMGQNRWHYSVETVPDGAAVAVTGQGANAAMRIRAHGFIGTLVVGTHHPDHHLAIARGTSLHAH